MHSNKSKPKHNPNFSQSLHFEAIGTHWTIDLPSLEVSNYNEIRRDIAERIELFDKTYSRFRSDSLISTMAIHPGVYPMPDDGLSLFSLYEKLYNVSDGKFTPLIGSLLTQAGYDKDYSLVPKEMTPVLRWEDVLSYDAQNITLSSPTFLDFGAGGKGYLIDIIGDILSKHDIHTFCIDGSGDILTRSDTKLRVGLEHPNNDNQIIGVVEIQNESICGSSGNRRKWDRFHHILNPHTRLSPVDILSTWVIAKDTVTADALATCLFLTKPETLLTEFEFEYLLLNANYTINKSAGFHAELYYN